MRKLFSEDTKLTMNQNLKKQFGFASYSNTRKKI